MLEPGSPSRQRRLEYPRRTYVLLSLCVAYTVRSYCFSLLTVVSLLPRTLRNPDFYHVRPFTTAYKGGKFKLAISKRHVSRNTV